MTLYLSWYLSQMAAMFPTFSARERVEIEVLFFGNPGLDAIGDLCLGPARHIQVLSNVKPIWQMLIHVFRVAFLSMTWRGRRKKELKIHLKWLQGFMDPQSALSAPYQMHQAGKTKVPLFSAGLRLLRGCFLSHPFKIMQSRATGIDDHTLPLGDLWILLFHSFLYPQHFVNDARYQSIKNRP